MEERLQKVLARAGFASRRGAEQLISEGRVTVNGAVVHELGTKADAGRDEIRVDGIRVKPPAGPVYLVLNKPRGVVTTRRDPEGRPTVMDLLPNVPGLFPVGRLDVTTEGLLILTNDGAFAERVSHPRYEVPRVYHAKVHGVPDERALERLRRGVLVDGDLLAADRARLLSSEGNAWLELTLHEGRQHEVKRLLEAVGHPVAKLRRVAFGPVTAHKLEPGQYRELRPEEVAGLLRGEGRTSTPVKRPRRPQPRTADGLRARRPPGTRRTATQRPGSRPATRLGPGRTHADARGRHGERGGQHGERGGQHGELGGQHGERRGQARRSGGRRP